jgi:hypothetical protein
MILIFILQLASVVRPSGYNKFLDHCPANSNGCIRVNKFNQYRANNIEMRLPVTFKQVNLTQLIEEWSVDQFGSKDIIEVHDNSELREAAKQANQPIPAFETYYYLFHTTWYGLVIDTLITVHECTQVFKAQTVTLQSQVRVGFKDYGRNYEVSQTLYSHLNDRVRTEGLKSFISCS